MLVSLIISGVIYVIGGYSGEDGVNTLQCFDMTTQKWATLQPKKEKRSNAAVCLQGVRIIVAGGYNGSKYIDTCEVFDTKEKRFVLLHPCSASHHCLSNSYSANVDLPFTCSWSTLPRMTAKRAYFSLVCLPPNEGGLIAIGGYNNDDHIDVAECLETEGATEWRRLAPLPLPLSSRGGVYFKQKILVVGGQTAGNNKTSATLVFTPPIAGGAGQWVTLKPTLPSPEFPMHITICGNSLYLVSKFTP